MPKCFTCLVVIVCLQMPKGLKLWINFLNIQVAVTRLTGSILGLSVLTSVHFHAKSMYGWIYVWQWNFCLRSWIKFKLEYMINPSMAVEG